MGSHYIIDNTFYPYSVVSEIFESVSCPKHMHLAGEIILVNEGVLNVIVGDEKYELTRGEAVFIPPFVPHEVVKKEANTSRVITFAKELLYEAVGGGSVTHVKNHEFELNSAIIGLLDFYLPNKRSVGGPMLAKCVLSPILYEVARRCEFVKETSTEKDVLLRTLNYMGSHYKEDLTLESVASKMGLHSVSLSKLFAGKMGITFIKFLKYLRVTSAVQLILTDKNSFTEIAYEVGFGSVRSFNRAFAEVYGITPTEYKAKNLQG